jgi:hypothetical protein
LGYKAGLDGVLDRRDVPVFPQVVAGRLGLRLPFRGVADSHPDAESLLGADHDAVHRVCLDTVDAIPEDRRGLPIHLDEAVEKLAGREPRLADVVLARPDPAWDVCLGLLASVGLAGRWARRHAAVELYRPDEAQSAG